MTTQVEPKPRRAARLLVVDPAVGAVLLFAYEDEGRRWWGTPGGGLEGDENFEEAAIREAAEELAIQFPRLAPLWRRTVEFSLRGVRVRQEEQYFLLQASRVDVPLGELVQDAHREEGVVRFKWWSLPELERTAERVFPEDLPQRLRVAGVAEPLGP